MPLRRFLEAQSSTYDTALQEIRNGRKQSHWMWFIFPQIAGLGKSETSQFYAIANITEANLYLHQPILGARLIEISRVLLQLRSTNATSIFGTIDDRKLKSCMTLFAGLPGADPVFQEVLNKFFSGKKDERTLKLIKT